MKYQRGFTLKELLIVIFFVALSLGIFLAGIATFIWLIVKFA